MKKTLSTMTILTIALFVLSMLSACSSPEEPMVREMSKEDIVLEQLKEGKLIAFLENSLTIPEGSTRENKVAIRNAYDVPTLYNIEICENCEFAETSVELGPNETRFISFKVRPVPGEKTLVIRDSNNNFYAKDTFLVR
ncbi:hypothetical protein ACFL0V_01715 [Nanoarchaeota archaeon]